MIVESFDCCNPPFERLGAGMAVFEFLRLSLSVPTIGDLLIPSNNGEPDTNRQDFLAEAFSARRDFFHAGRMFSYVPCPSSVQGPNLYSGWIGKPVTDMVNSGPDQSFVLTKHQHYKASFVAADVSAGSQIVAFEKRGDVGASRNILVSLFESFLRERKTYSWRTDVEYMSNQKDFWKAAVENKGRITELSFEFFPPNGLKGFEKFKEFDRLAKQQANAKSSEYAVKNPDGQIVPEGEFVESAVEYASEGPGNIRMKNGRKTIYNSRQAKKTKDVPEDAMPRLGELTKILGLLGWLFGTKPHDG